MDAEKKLILELTRFLDPNVNEIEYLLGKHVDFPYVLGQLAYNRVGGVAYSVLKHAGLLSKVNREFRTSLKTLYEMNCIKHNAFRAALTELAECFKNADFPYAFLKGSFLSSVLYPEGLRTSNDYDILVAQKDVDACEKILGQNGFTQGKYVEGKGIVAAARREIISSRMNRGETVPFVKRSGRQGQDIIEVDVNFSLDFKSKNNTDAVPLLLDNSTPFPVNELEKLYTLAPVDFLIHLCAHLYKEAATYNWVSMGRDLSLYKFLDIYVFIIKSDTPALTQRNQDAFHLMLSRRIQQLGLQKECYYAIYYTTWLYPGLLKYGSVKELLSTIKPDSIEYLNRVYDPANKREYEYGTNFLNRFFAANRMSDLTEV